MQKKSVFIQCTVYFSTVSRILALVQTTTLGTILKIRSHRPMLTPPKVAGLMEGRFPTAQMRPNKKSNESIHIPT